MEIRKLASQDALDIQTVLNTHQQEPYFEPYGLNWTENQIKNALQHLSWGIFEAGQCVSFICLRRAHESLLELDLMVTRKDMSHKNYMNKLITHIRREYFGREIWLEVHQNNLRALKFYEKQGFLKVGERPRYYPDGGVAILMSLKSP